MSRVVQACYGHTAKSKGSAFVWYAQREHATMAMLAMHGRLSLPKRDGHNGRPLTVRPAVHARASPAHGRGKLPAAWPRHVAQIQAAQISCCAMRQYAPSVAQGAAIPSFALDAPVCGSASAPANILPTTHMAASAGPSPDLLRPSAGNMPAASSSDMLATLRLLLTLQSQNDQLGCASGASASDVGTELSPQLQNLSLHLGSAGVSSSNGITSAANNASIGPVSCSLSDSKAALPSAHSSTQDGSGAHHAVPALDAAGFGAPPVRNRDQGHPLPGAVELSAASQLNKLHSDVQGVPGTTVQQVKLWMQNVDAADAASSAHDNAIRSPHSDLSP
jgi:hypothetical protein